MASTEKNLRAIQKMLDEKFKLSETKEAYEAMKRKGDPTAFANKALNGRTLFHHSIYEVVDYLRIMAWLQVGVKIGLAKTRIHPLNS